MELKRYFNEMESVRDEVFALPGMQDTRATLGAGLSGFWARTKFALRLMLTETELITFAILQWACVIAGYYLWVQMLAWIPEETWRAAAESERVSVPDLVLFAWSFVCVGLVAFPLGLLTGAMGAVHVQHRLGQESTIAGCLKMVAPRAWPLWIFHWIDGWWTVNRILDRLPKKNDRRTPAQKALSEALYYAWKVATIGIVPGLVTGRGLIDAGRRSVGMVRARFSDVIILRGGYSALCWIVGVGAYIGTIFFFIKFPGLVDFNAPTESQIFKFYFWAGIPLIVSVGVVMLFLRPVYIISACDIYADYVREREENLVLPPPPRGAVNADTFAFVAVALLALAAAFIFRFREELGVVELLGRLG
ncbi:MAG: hypothetical protein FD189_1782 [Elusimicrobia bacterium]|nr:MAG: hypothetical protein FD154_1925 [Elusimicrobiota bacterium]KAF0154598.1 MAG: hypothetical protein FD189_1782 [Elusimicrobiota bacterium]